MTMRSPPVYLNYSQTELDHCYDQRVWARDSEAAIARCGAASAAARDVTAHHADLAYGEGADERLDWFPAPGPSAPIHVHLHGGAWRRLTKADASFAAPAFVEAGVHYVVPNFSKLPAARLPDVVDQVARALAFVHRRAEGMGGDPDRILLSGHSSGAHLAAVLMTLDWRERGAPADLIKAGLCIGGIYDLEPVILSARGEYVRLTATETRTFSPRLHAGSIRCPTTIVFGGRESPEFKRQAAAFAADLTADGRACRLVEIPDTDHFELNEMLGQPESPVHRAAVAALAEVTGRTGARADAPA